MNNLNGERIMALIRGILIAVIVVAVAGTAISFLWPLLLAVAVYFGYRILKNRLEIKRMEKQNAETMEKDLFYEQIRRREASGDIIDVEFTESESNDNK